MSSRNNGSSGSQGGGFWEKNGPGIMSATGSALSTTFKAGKYVAKTGYAAGKSHYNSQKGRKSDDSSEAKDSTASSGPTMSSRSVESFNPPPLRPGQMQYQRGGTTVEAGDQPLARQHQVLQHVPSANSVHSQHEHSVSPANSVNPQNLQPLYNAEGAIIGYIPIQSQYPAASAQQVSQQPPPLSNKPSYSQEQQPSAPSVASRAPLPNPVLQEAGPIHSRAPAPLPPTADPSLRKPPAIPQRTDSSMTVESFGSRESDSPQFEVTPYEFTDPEERANAKRLTIENKIDVTKMAPPPLHRGRGSSLEKTFSQIVDEKIKSNSSVVDTRSSSTSLANSSQKSLQNIPQIDAEDEPHKDNVSAPPRIEVAPARQASFENSEPEKPEILSKYDYSKTVPFQPPPQSFVPEGFIAPSTRIANMRQESESKRHHSRNETKQFTQAPPPPLRGNSSASVNSHSRSVAGSSSVHVPGKSSSPVPPQLTQRKSLNPPADKNAADELANRPAVLGSYDYNKKVDFLPPPTAKRSERDLEFIHQKQERTRISTSSIQREQSSTRSQKKAVVMLVPEPVVPERSAAAGNSPAYDNQKPADFTETHAFNPPPLKPVKPTVLSANVPPQKPKKPEIIASENTLRQPPPKPTKPGAIKAPPKPKKPAALQVEQTDPDFNPFAKYDPKSAV